MSSNSTNMYDVDEHIAEIYDQTDQYTDDLELIRALITEQAWSGGQSTLRILEPFCGTGRLLLPLAADGHTLVGLDQSAGMLSRARAKAQTLPKAERERITLIQCDLTQDPWPEGFDLVLLGGNCFYELATPQEQEAVISAATRSLKPGGWLYVDNDHMDGELDPSWQQPDVKTGFPSGVCTDGTRLESTVETIWWDAPGRLARFRRRTVVTSPDGQVRTVEYTQQKHPPSTNEVSVMLAALGLKVGEQFGDYQKGAYTFESPRAIFWCQKNYEAVIRVKSAYAY